MKRYVTEKVDGGYVVMDQTLNVRVSLPFPTRTEAVARARELDSLIQLQAKKPREDSPVVYIGGQKVDISGFGESARRQIIEALEKEKQ